MGHEIEQVLLDRGHSVALIIDQENAHDLCAEKLAGVDVAIEDLTLEDLEQYRLENTTEKIPTFQEVLELFSGKATVQSRGNIPLEHSSFNKYRSGTAKRINQRGFIFPEAE